MGGVVFGMVLGLLFVTVALWGKVMKLQREVAGLKVAIITTAPGHWMLGSAPKR
jgi:hypothetical protein